MTLREIIAEMWIPQWDVSPMNVQVGCNDETVQN